MQFDTLYHVNAAGCYTESFYTSVANQMLYSKPSKALIRCDISLDAPYVFVELTELAGFDRQTRCLLILSHVIENIELKKLCCSFRVNKVQFILPHASNGEPLIDDDTLSELLTNAMPEQTPAFEQVSDWQLEATDLDTLVVAVDSCNDFEYVSEQAKHHTVQVVNGPSGVINGEGGYALLVHRQGCLKATTFDESMPTQLQSANIQVSDSFIFAGMQSYEWQKQWFSYTQKHYKNDDELIEFAELNTVLGYQGVANQSAAFALAGSYLHNPLMADIEHVFVVFNQPNEQLFKISRSESECHI